eukprot:TRINITY_DN9947_c0_g1_i2.p1 TRINITY_DN9947_c0_g1~~TRINITY_DN9947_c0_g1_i2.p1  ORF type:complete len:403 (+),score=104.80 TRINITY_DN9947_c0_g1_i2:19-1227(+)
MSSEILNQLNDTLSQQKGVLFVLPAIVSRASYCGRNIVSRNSEKEDTDERGYYAVERWIVSKTLAENDKPKENEGLSYVILKAKDQSIRKVQLVDLLKADQKKVMGEYADKWPLTKILDIGGKPVKPNFGDASDEVPEEEIPPIPAHVHYGNVCNGKASKCGKKEAYFFPPVDVEPFNASFGKTITRLGFKEGIDKEKFRRGLEKFGVDDSVYGLMEKYPINTYDGWTILPGVIHAPGPWLTFEIQLPQDDFNLAAWQLGKKITDEATRKETCDQLQLKGLSVDNFTAEVIEWELSTDKKFKDKYYRPAEVIEQGDFGRTIQIFFDGFYGEGYEVKAGQTYTRAADKRPFGGVVWSGEGLLNGNPVSATDDNCKEFLVVPNTPLEIKATAKPLFLYVVFPLE